MVRPCVEGKKERGREGGRKEGGKGLAVHLVIQQMFRIFF
jgi:hypothetical protein